MNIYLIGVIISMIIYILVGTFAGRKVKNIDDYYVAGRNAPTILIVGSLVASFLSTGAFLGDTGEVYSGFFMPIVIVGVMQGTGYLFGSALFGRFVRRSDADVSWNYDYYCCNSIYAFRHSGHFHFNVLNHWIVVLCLRHYCMDFICCVYRVVRFFGSADY